MRHYYRPLCGWALALAIAQRLCHANGEGSVTAVSTAQQRHQATRSSRGTSLTAFAVPLPSNFAAPVGARSPAATAGERHAGGQAGVAAAAARESARSGRNRHCGGGGGGDGVWSLEAKKSQMKAEEDEFR